MKEVRTMTVGKRSSCMHLVCVVCGKGFSSTFNEELNMYPLYHPKKSDNSGGECEAQFYEALLSIYECLHSQETSIQIPQLMNAVKWGNVQLRREMLMWCLNQGFLSVDTLKRIIVPPVIDDITKELFSTDNLSDPDFALKAIDYLKSTFVVFKDQLQGTSLEKEPEEREPDKVDERLEEQLDERRKISRMFTVDVSGVEDRNKERIRSKGKGMHSR